MSQALNVNAEGDGHGAQRTLSSPRGGGRLALPWSAILGIVLGGLVAAGLATAVLARRRVRRTYQVRVSCWSSLTRRGSAASSCAEQQERHAVSRLSSRMQPALLEQLHDSCVCCPPPRSLPRTRVTVEFAVRGETTLGVI